MDFRIWEHRDSELIDLMEFPYETIETKPSFLYANKEEFEKHWLKEKNIIKEKLEKNKKSEEINHALAKEYKQEHFDYIDQVLYQKNVLYTTDDLAYDYGYTEEIMNEILEYFGFQKKIKIDFEDERFFGIDETWVLTEEYQSKGLVTIEISNGKPYLNWLPKGRIVVYQKLKKFNLLPIVEQKYDDIVINKLK